MSDRIVKYPLTESPGIDYGLGKTNVDTEVCIDGIKSQIRFGVISMNADGLSEWVWDSLEADYGDPTCPSCGNAVKDYAEGVAELEKNPEEREGVTSEADLRNYRARSAADYVCLDCGLVLAGEDVYGDDPVGWSISDPEYTGSVDSQNDLFITRSPYFTWAQFCSPCAPGAGHLENPTPPGCGVRTYCLGHDWFTGDEAPYPVYSVATGELVPPGEQPASA